MLSCSTPAASYFCFSVARFQQQSDHTLMMQALYWHCSGNVSAVFITMPYYLIRTCNTPAAAGAGAAAAAAAAAAG
jgi:hypothetical protein